MVTIGTAGVRGRACVHMLHVGKGLSYFGAVWVWGGARGEWSRGRWPILHSCADKVEYSLLIPASLRVDGNCPCVGDRRAVWRKLARVCQLKAPFFHAEAVGAQATCRSKNKTFILSNSLLLCVFPSRIRHVVSRNIQKAVVFKRC